MYVCFLIIGILSFIACLVTVAGLVIHRICDEQKYLLMASVSALIGGIGYFVEMTAADVPVSLVGVKLQNIGNAFYMFFFLIFVKAILGERLLHKAVALLTVLTFARCVLACAASTDAGNVFAGLYFGEVHAKEFGWGTMLYFQQGWGYCAAVLLDIIILGCAIWRVLHRILAVAMEERRTYLWVVHIAAVHILVILLYVSRLFCPYEFMPICDAIMCYVCSMCMVKGDIIKMLNVQFFASSEVFQRMQQGVIMLDRFYNLMGCNDMARRVFPELKEVRRGDKVTQIAKLMEIVQSRTVDDFEVDGAYYKAAATPVINRGELSGYSVWLYDVTQSHRYTQELLRVKEEADHSNKEKSNFLANMSHEIRTPMNVIIGSTELILREDASDAVLENASTIKQAGQNLLGIINDILDFSKIEAGKMEITPVEYSLDAMMQDLVNMTIVRMDEKPLGLVVDVDTSIPHHLFGDDIRIKQILINFLTNAVKFTEKGHITIRVRKDGEAKEADVVQLRFDIRDSGIGIKEENIKNLFDSFSRFDTIKNRAVEGTGLGLAIAQMLAKNMDGRLEVSSEYGHGSCFSLILPQRICAENKPLQVLYENALILETDPEYAGIFEEAFRHAGIRYTLARKEEQFFELLNRSYDILFLNKKAYEGTLVTGLKADKVVMLDHQETTPKKNEEDILIMKQLLGIKLHSILDKTYSKELRSNAKASEQKFVAPDARVLVVDDNAVNLKIAMGLLKPFKLQVDTAGSGMQAIEKIENNEYDIVFMDHMMPEMDGIETTAKIRSKYGEKYQNLTIVALTANAVNGAKNIFLSSGMQDFLSKPIQMDRMIAILKKWLPEEKILDKPDDAQDDKKEEKPQKAGNKGDIKGISVESGIRHYQQDEQQYKMALRVYSMMAGRLIDEIEKNIVNHDLSGVGRIAHTLGEESSKVGADKIAKFLEKYEKACKEDNEKFVVGNYSFLHKLYDEIAEGLQAFMEE